MAYTDKRRNWSQEDDLTLLKQVAADTLFAAEKGQLRKAWQGLVETLMSCENFGRVVDGKKVQNRFLALVDEHRKFDATSARLSGSDQEEKEKHMLLDDIITLLDEKQLAFEREKFESELQQRQLDREDRKAEREHQLVLANIESAKMTNIIKVLLDSKK